MFDFVVHWVSPGLIPSCNEYINDSHVVPFQSDTLKIWGLLHQVAGAVPNVVLLYNTISMAPYLFCEGVAAIFLRSCNSPEVEFVFFDARLEVE